MVALEPEKDQTAKSIVERALKSYSGKGQIINSPEEAASGSTVVEIQFKRGPGPDEQKVYVQFANNREADRFNRDEEVTKILCGRENEHAVDIYYHEIEKDKPASPS